MANQWWAVQRKGRWGRNRKWKTIFVHRTRRNARVSRDFNKGVSSGFTFRVSPCSIVVQEKP